MKWRGRRVFGDHKTFRGFAFGIGAAMIVAGVQKYLFLDFAFFRDFSMIDYGVHSAAVLGLLMGFGALFGDAVKSFFKRRSGIRPGRPWIPFDQLDFVVGSLLLLALVFIPPWQSVVFLMVAVPVLHILTNHVGYYLGINKSKW